MLREDGIRPFAFVFPGQGSQRQGMLDVLPETEDLDRLLDAAEALTGLELRAIAALGTDEDLADTRVAQPLLYLTDWAWANALIDAGLSPDAVAGHSLGEFAALAIAEVFSVEAGLELVVERSRLMSSVAAATPGGMVAVLGMERELVGDLIAPMSSVWLANDNGPGQVILSGTPKGLDKATAELTMAGARRVIPLKLSGPFHSPLMEPAREAFAEILDQTEFAPSLVPVLQNTGPTPCTDPALIKSRLALQMTAPVRWNETMLAFRDMGVEVLVEAGPGAVLSGLARKVPGIDAASVEEAGIETIAEEVL